MLPRQFNFSNQQGETVMTTTTTRKDESKEEQDAIEMLMADHKKVKKLFGNFETRKDDGDDEDKSAIVKLICNELKVHTTLEEEIFYPAVRKAIQDSVLMDEALVEHAGAKELIAQLEEADPEDDLYDAKVTVLGEQIDHHVKEEEGDMFPKAKKAKVDTAALGAQMLKRKAALMAEMGMDKEGADETRPSGQKKNTGTRG
jgi:hemerythrin superfamily protein